MEICNKKCLMCNVIELSSGLLATKMGFNVWGYVKEQSIFTAMQHYNFTLSTLPCRIVAVFIIGSSILKDNHYSMFENGLEWSRMIPRSNAFWPIDWLKLMLLLGTTWHGRVTATIMKYRPIHLLLFCVNLLSIYEPSCMPLYFFVKGNFSSAKQMPEVKYFRERNWSHHFKYNFTQLNTLKKLKD